jgi:Ca-activated chloride channel family protein
MHALHFAAAVGALTLLCSTSVVHGAPPRGASRGREAPSTPVRELGRFDFGDPERLPLVSQTIAIAIDGQHANTVSTLVHRNAADGRVEGLATLHLAESARITGFSYWNGAERIVGEVLPRATAREIYDETVGRRRDPGLLEQTGPGRYSLEVFPIEPGERKRTQFEWAQWLEQHAGEVSYRAPLAGAGAEVSVEIADARGVSGLRSSSHDLRITTEDGRTRITGRARSKTTREFQLQWTIGAPPMAMHGWVHREPGEDGYVLLHVAAPAPSKTTRVPKDVTLVLDESGSMEGEPLENGKAAAAAIVDRLDAADRLNVVLFDDRAEALFDAPRPVTAEVRRRAQRFIDGAGNGGGTDVALALQTALGRQADDDRPKSVLLLTDGESPREPAFAAVDADKRDVRLFTIGVGAHVDTAALQRLAALKRGRYTPIAAASEIRPAVQQLYARMAAPVFVGLALAAEGPTLVRTYPATLPDLFAGDEIVITARVQGDGALDLRLTGTTTAGVTTLQQTLNIPTATRRPWVGSMWARARIEDLLTRLALAPQDADAPERIDEVTRLGVRYDLVTPYTSFLAIPESELTARTRELLERGRAGDGASATSTRLGRVVNMEEFRNVPVGSASNRDFTSVIESSATASRDSSGITLAGRAGRESKYAVDPQPAAAPRAGCAHCGAGNDGTGGATGLVLLVVALARRRRGQA